MKKIALVLVVSTMACMSSSLFAQDSTNVKKHRMPRPATEEQMEKRKEMKAKMEGMTPDQKEAFIQQMRKERRAKMDSMSPEKRAEIKEMRKAKMESMTPEQKEKMKAQRKQNRAALDTTRKGN